MNYLAFSLGIIAFLLYIFSLQCKNKKNILSFQCLANLFYSLQYFLLNAYSGAYTSVLAMFRCLFYNHFEKNNKTIPIILPILFLFLILIFSIFTYKNTISLLPILINILFIIFTYIKNLKYLRINALICAILWFIYNINVEAYGALIGNILEIISAIIALKRYKGEKHE